MIISFCGVMEDWRICVCIYGVAKIKSIYWITHQIQLQTGIPLTTLYFQDIYFGEKFSKDFADSHEDRDTAEGLMNLHNNEAGRRVSVVEYVNLAFFCRGDTNFGFL